MTAFDDEMERIRLALIRDIVRKTDARMMGSLEIFDGQAKVDPETGGKYVEVALPDTFKDKETA